jgi:hypothetical protein
MSNIELKFSPIFFTSKIQIFEKVPWSRDIQKSVSGVYVHVRSVSLSMFMHVSMSTSVSLPMSIVHVYVHAT